MKIFCRLFTVLMMFVFSALAQTETGKATSPPQAKASIAGKPGGEIRKDELLNSKGLETADLNHYILEYRMSIAGPGVQYQEIQGSDSTLNDRMRMAIRSAQPGAKVYFEYIKCADKDNNTHMLAPLTFIIK
jgi:hypothetical protein